MGEISNDALNTSRIDPGEPDPLELDNFSGFTFHRLFAGTANLSLLRKE